MKKFRTAFINGYQKSEVDEYLEDMMIELEDLRRDAQKGQAAERLRVQMEQMETEKEELQEQLRTREEEIQALTRQLEEKEHLLQQLQEEESRLQEEKKHLSDLNEQFAEKEEKLRKYESDYSSFMDLMVNMKSQARKIVTDAQADAEEILRMAKKDADDITSSAQSDAEKITDQAKMSARDYQQDVEKQMEKKQKEEELKFQLARFKISEYLESLNRSQNMLIEVYEDFGRLVGQLPLRIGDVFSEEPFELLAEQGKEKTNENASVESEKETEEKTS